MLNLFKHQWLPYYIRDYILKKFPEKHFRVEFKIGGKMVALSQVVGNERRVEKGYVTYIDSEGNTELQWLFLFGGEITFGSVNFAKGQFSLDGIEPDLRKPPLVGKKDEVENYRKMLKKSSPMPWTTALVLSWTGFTNTPLPTCPAGDASAFLTYLPIWARTEYLLLSPLTWTMRRLASWNSSMTNWSWP